MNKYIYDGPVMFFGRFVGNWHGETMAETEVKARNNLVFQYKKQHNLNASSGSIGLPGKIKVLERMYA